MSNKNTVRFQGIDFNSFLVGEAITRIETELHNTVIEWGSDDKGINNSELAYIGKLYIDIITLRSVKGMLENDIPFTKEYTKYLEETFSKEEYKSFFDGFRKHLKYWEKEREATWDIVSKIAKHAILKEGK